MEIKTMQNELCRIGMIIFDLRRGLSFSPDVNDLGFFAEEFRRITLSLGYRWSERVPGFPYLLDFHKVEASRLMDIVYKLDTLQFELIDTSSHNKFLHDLYVELILHLADLLANLDKMTDVSGFSTGRFDLN